MSRSVYAGKTGDCVAVFEFDVRFYELRSEKYTRKSVKQTIPVDMRIEGLT